MMTMVIMMIKNWLHFGYSGSCMQVKSPLAFTNRAAATYEVLVPAALSITPGSSVLDGSADCRRLTIAKQRDSPLPRGMSGGSARPSAICGSEGLNPNNVQSRGASDTPYRLIFARDSSVNSLKPLVLHSDESLHSTRFVLAGFTASAAGSRRTRKLHWQSIGGCHHPARCGATVRQDLPVPAIC